jgi:hypothetical protein
VDEPGPLQHADVMADFRLVDLAGEILKRSQRLVVFGVGERVEDSEFGRAGSIERVEDRLLIGHGEFRLLRVRASVRVPSVPGPLDYWSRAG